MANWHMLTLVGRDRPGIVAQVTRAIYEAGGNLGEASMVRLGGNFSIMMMVSGVSAPQLQAYLHPVVQSLDLRLHIDPIAGSLHQHQEPNVRVCLSGADRAGIVAELTGALAEQGLNILSLESDVGGDAAHPLYILCIQGYCDRPIEQLKQAVSPLVARGMSLEIAPLETLVG